MKPKGPVGLGNWAANEGSILLNNIQWRSPCKEVEVEHAPDDLVGQCITSIENVHPIAVQQQNSMRDSSVPYIHVIRMGAIQICIQIYCRNVSCEQSISFFGKNFDPVGLCVLAQSIQGSCCRKASGELQVLIFEDQVPIGRVEEDIPIGFALYCKPKWIGNEGDDQLPSSKLRELES